MAVSLHESRETNIPEGCEISLDGKALTFNGALGKQIFNFSKHKFTFELINRKIQIHSWHSNGNKNDRLNSLISEINNNANGVITGFRYVLQTISRHFPMQIIIEDEGKVVVIKNFLGRKFPMTFRLLEGVKAVYGETKDKFYIQGINLKNVSQSAGTIRTSITSLKRNDPRIFLDGIYLIKKTTIITTD